MTIPELIEGLHTIQDELGGDAQAASKAAAELCLDYFAAQSVEAVLADNHIAKDDFAW